MKSQHSRKVAVIGTGLVGRAWAIVFARSGLEVNLFDENALALQSSINLIKDLVSDMKGHGLTQLPVEDILNNISAKSSLQEACSDVYLVQENIKETLEAKIEIFKQLDDCTHPDTLLASSTSWIPTSKFTKELKGRSRCFVAHPTNPPYLIPLVEISPAPWTLQDHVQRAMEFYFTVNQEPVLVKKEIHGFLLNRVQGAVLNEMLNLFEQGYASSADLDKVMKFGLGLRWSFMGPFETIDLNAPAGVSDYALRFGHTYAQVAKTQLPNDWRAEVIKAIEQERREKLSEESLAQRSRWRDNRLMALRAHQMNEPD
jgi:L-gulonate 3-dehydrogenase